MLSLAFGLIAALCWGTHDFLVRFVTQRSAAMSALLVLLVIGTTILVPVSLIFGDWGRMTGKAAGLAALSGLAYALGGVGLYKAFAIGPVRLVAPITGSYPVMSVGWAAISGVPVSGGQWLAVLAVVAGIGLVAALSEDHADADQTGTRAQAVLWSIAGSVGFALTFALGQQATRLGDEFPVQALTRVAGLAAFGLVLAVQKHRLQLYRPHLPLLAMMAVLDLIAIGVVLAAGTLAHSEYASVASSIFGVVAILLAWKFLGERVSAAQLVGIFVVFAGVAWLALE